MSTSKEYLKFKKNNAQSLSNLKNKKLNFEPTYYQVIEKNIKDDKQHENLFNKLNKLSDEVNNQ